MLARSQSRALVDGPLDDVCEEGKSPLCRQRSLAGVHLPSGGRSWKRWQEHISLHSSMKRKLSSSLSDSSLSLLSDSGSRRAAGPGESQPPSHPTPPLACRSTARLVMMQDRLMAAVSHQFGTGTKAGKESLAASPGSVR